MLYPTRFITRILLRYSPSSRDLDFLSTTPLQKAKDNRRTQSEILTVRVFELKLKSQCILAPTPVSEGPSISVRRFVAGILHRYRFGVLVPESSCGLNCRESQDRWVTVVTGRSFSTRSCLGNGGTLAGCDKFVIMESLLHRRPPSKWSGYE